VKIFFDGEKGRLVSEKRVIIVGGGFAGLAAAKKLKNSDIDLLLIDRTNHHLFQPLLYQVATAALSQGDIAVPIREIVRKHFSASESIEYPSAKPSIARLSSASSN